jgi:2-dehydro-3-deoxygluconokinase
VAFDGNYRPHGWGDTATARRAFNDILPLTDLALPTLEDEQALFRMVKQLVVSRVSRTPG